MSYDMTDYAAELLKSNQELTAQVKALTDALPPKPLMSCTRLQFQGLSPSEQMQFIKRGGRIADEGYAGTRVRGVGGVLV